MLFLALTVFDYRRWARLAWPAYLFTVGLLGAVLVIGRTVNGSKRWLGLGMLGGQPSELMDLLIVYKWPTDIFPDFARDPAEL